MAYSLEEVEFLAENRDAIAASAQTLQLSKASTMADMDKLRKQFGEHSRAVAELITARRAGLKTHKFPPHHAEQAGKNVTPVDQDESSCWLVDTDSVQQATPYPVAQFRAQEFASLGITQIHDVTCSVGFEGAALTAAGLNYIGSDIDRIRLAMSRRNIPEGHFLQADALTQTTTADVILADPRPGRRTTHNLSSRLTPTPA